MKIIVCGAGTIGRSIVSYLAQGNNDVIVIDNDQKNLDVLTKEWDVQPIFGSSSHPAVLEKAGIEDADLILAVTNNDEANIVTCEIAHLMFGVPQKIARLSSSFNDSRWVELFNDKNIAIDRVISPDMEVAEAIYTLLKIPGAFEAFPFADKKLHIVAVAIGRKSPLLRTSLSHIDQAVPELDIKITNIIRKSKSFIPSEDDVIEEGDKIYYLVDSDKVEDSIQLLGASNPSNERVIIFGGNSIAYHLAEMIERDDNFLSAKIIDDDFVKAADLARELEDTIVIDGDMMSDVILDEAGIDRADATIAVTNFDKDNLLASLVASSRGVPTKISLINTRKYNSLISDIGDSILVDMSSVMISKILKEIRKSKMTRAYSLGRGLGEVWEIEVDDESALIDKRIADIKVPSKSNISAIVRGDEILFAKPHDKIKAGDILIVFVDSGDVKRVENIFH